MHCSNKVFMTTSWNIKFFAAKVEEVPLLKKMNSPSVHEAADGENNTADFLENKMQYERVMDWCFK